MMTGKKLDHFIGFASLRENVIVLSPFVSPVTLLSLATTPGPIMENILQRINLSTSLANKINLVQYKVEAT